MPLFDFLTAIVLTISVIYSIVRGMVREIFSLLAYIGGYFLAIAFKGNVSSVINQYISNSTASEIISFGFIFVGSVIVISLLGKGIQKLIHLAPGLSALDRLFGGILGIAKGVVILIILMFPIKYFPDLNTQITKDSFFAPHLNNLSQILSRGVNSDRFIENFPNIDLSGVKENIKNWEGLDKLAQDLKHIRSGSEKSEELQGDPQDKYTKEEKNKLNDILLSLDKK